MFLSYGAYPKASQKRSIFLKSIFWYTPVGKILKNHFLFPVFRARGLAWIGHQPSKLGVAGSNPAAPAYIVNLKKCFVMIYFPKMKLYI